MVWEVVERVGGIIRKGRWMVDSGYKRKDKYGEGYRQNIQ